MEKDHLIKTRKALPGDFYEISKLICELEETNFDKKSLQKIYMKNLANPGIYYLVAEGQKAVVGFLSLYIQPLLHHCGNVAEIQELIINEDRRGAGIGRILMRKACEIARKNKCLTLEVSCNKNRKKAHNFYNLCGMEHSHFKFTMSLQKNARIIGSSL